jgi:hypothetical protein
MNKLADMAEISRLHELHEQWFCNKKQKVPVNKLT